MADWVQEARRAATRYGVDPRIFVAQIRAESGGREGVSSGAGARDIAQFIPSTARQYGVTLGDGRISDDLDGAARLMRDSLKKTGGDYRAALSIYNSGRPDGYKRFGETRAYVAKIMGAAGGAPAHNGGASQLAAPKVAPQPPGTSGLASGASVADQRQDVLKQYLLQRGRPGSILALATGLRDVKAPDAPAATAHSPAATPAADATAPAATGGSKLLELFWQGPGGINVKNGAKVPQGFVSGHQDHVHVAAGPKTVVQLGKLAQRMGLNVGENPHFGTVHPVHVANSYHYKGEAIDVSGPTAKMRAFAHRVAQGYGIKP
jgi:hypothetical protein